MSNLTSHVWVNHPERGAELLEPGDSVPAWAKDQVTNPACFTTHAQPDDEPDTGDDSDVDDGQGDVDYMSWKKDELEAEVDRRNAEYADDDQLEVQAPGNKQELAAALAADDEDQADDSDGDDGQE